MTNVDYKSEGCLTVGELRTIIEHVEDDVEIRIIMDGFRTGTDMVFTDDGPGGPCINISTQEEVAEKQQMIELGAKAIEETHMTDWMNLGPKGVSERVLNAAFEVYGG